MSSASLLMDNIGGAIFLSEKPCVNETIFYAVKLLFAVFA